MSARKRTTSLGEASLDVLHHDYPQSHIQTTDHQPRHLPRILKSETDPSLGWKPLRHKSRDTPVSKGIKDGMVVAFAFREEDEDDADFNVQFPTYDYEEEGDVAQEDEMEG